LLLVAYSVYSGKQSIPKEGKPKSQKKTTVVSYIILSTFKYICLHVANELDE
jgi:hypothetical protein